MLLYGVLSKDSAAVFANFHYMLHCIVSTASIHGAYMLCFTVFGLVELFFLLTGGADMAGADRDDLEQLERAVRGRLLEIQILKLSAQCRASQSQFDAYLDVANTNARPKVSTTLPCVRISANTSVSAVLFTLITSVESSPLLAYSAETQNCCRVTHCYLMPEQGRHI